MARPVKLNADWFRHDHDMRDDPKIKALRTKYGLEGYAIYNMMLEVLTKSNYYTHRWNDLEIELLSGDFRIDPALLKEIITYCTETLLLFSIENGHINCSKLSERFETLMSKRDRQRSYYKPEEEKGFRTLKTKENVEKVVSNTQNKVSNTQNGVSGAQNTHTILDHIILDHTREERPTILDNKSNDREGEKVRRGSVSNPIKDEEKNPYDESVSEVIEKFIPVFNKSFRTKLSQDNINSIKNGILHHKDAIMGEFGTVRIFLKTAMLRMLDNNDIKEPIGYFISGAFGKTKYLWWLTAKEEDSTTTGYHKSMIAQLDKKSKIGELLK